MVARIDLKLERDENGFHLNGQRSVDFQAGVEYVISADDDIWVTWYDEQSHLQSAVPVNNVINLHNLTCVDHHRYVSDSLLYYVRYKKPIDLHGIPIGLWDKELEDILEDVQLEDDVSEYISNVILPSRKFETNGSFEELFNLEQEDELKYGTEVFPTTDNSVKDYFFNQSERYVAVIKDGSRVSQDLLKAYFVRNGNFNRIELLENTTSQVFVRTDLCHNARGNGSKQVTIIVREGDERKFFFNTYDQKLKTSLVGRGARSPENTTVIRNQFDDYVLTNFPELYEFMKAYYDYENIAGSASSFMRNMSDYFDVDVMPENLLRKKIQTVFGPVDSVVMDKRLLSKRLIDFFRSKGTPESFKWLANAMFKKEATIRRFTDEIIRLSESDDVAKYLVVPIAFEDIERLLTSGDVKKLNITYSNADDIANGLIGFVFQGRSTNSFAIVESVEKKEIQKKIFYVLRCVVKNGEFEDGELLDIRQISGHVNLNQLTLQHKRIAIRHVEVVNSSRDYSIGDSVVAISNTGEGFDAYVSRVDDNGSIKNIRVTNGGWFYRPAVDSLMIENDFRNVSIEFDPSKVKDASVIRTDGMTYTTLDGEVVPVEIVGTSLLVNKTYEINKGEYMANRPIGSSRYNNSVVFFGKDLTNGRILVVDEFDRAKQLDVEFTSDIIGIVATDRTLFVVTNTGFTTIAIADIYKSNPPKREVFVTSASGYPRAVFQVNNRMFCLTTANVIEVDSEGTVIGTWPVNKTYDFASHQRVGNVDVLYLGAKGELSAYQWYQGDSFAVLKPVYGYFTEEIVEESGSKNVLSGSSKIQDNDVYQDFSFGIVLDESTDAYMKNFNQIINPAGYKIFGVRSYDSTDVSVVAGSTNAEVNPLELPPIGYVYVVNGNDEYVVNEDDEFLIARV
ncbi:baseplate wedge subunit [Sinorhizobium phage phiM9]|uniref:Baseplate wedge subunit-like protein n=1 Tax=Sinorhizobium phage phiM9 TaxID=1636182 RepID=A0A0F6R7H4_9CAUD|nr:baseplate wedge subunit [Sinorhizobium phage phiM9]AKE44713.1 baseplate wedge subunit-like protein [Sinorhizobium phage phiM9]